MEMIFACKKCKKTFRKDMRDYDEVDEYCPHCDNHYVIEAKTPQAAIQVEGDDPRLMRDFRQRQIQLMELDFMAERLG
jgi:DNA-directed RNA polymerase subunit RPC12/RpoP